MKIYKELGLTMLMIIMVTWYVLLAYVMVNYVNEINKIDRCKNLASNEGTVIKAYGIYKLSVIGFLVFFGIYSVLSSYL